MEYVLLAAWLGLLGFGLTALVLLLRRQGPAGCLPGAFALLSALAGAAWAAPWFLRLALEGMPALWMGLGRLLAALALPAAYLLLYRCWELIFRPQARDQVVFWTLLGAGLLRLLLCLLPQNGWLGNELPTLWVTLRTAALAGMAAPVVVCWRSVRGENRALARVWLWELLSLLALLPGALGAVPLPELFFTASALLRAGTLLCFLKHSKKT